MSNVSLAGLYENEFAVTAQKPIEIPKNVGAWSYSPKPEIVKPRASTFVFGKHKRFVTDHSAPFISHQHAATDWSGSISPGPAVYNRGNITATLPRVPAVPWKLDKEKLKRQNDEKHWMQKVNRGIGPGSYNLDPLLHDDEANTLEYRVKGGDLGKAPRFKTIDHAVPGPIYKSFHVYQRQVRTAEPSYSFGKADTSRRREIVRSGTPVWDGKEEEPKKQKPVPPHTMMGVSTKRFARWGKESGFISHMHAAATAGIEGPGPAVYSPQLSLAADNSSLRSQSTANGLHWVP
jgi:hypothetical protein